MSSCNVEAVHNLTIMRLKKPILPSLSWMESSPAASLLQLSLLSRSSPKHCAAQSLESKCVRDQPQTQGFSYSFLAFAHIAELCGVVLNVVGQSKGQILVQQYSKLIIHRFNGKAVLVMPWEAPKVLVAFPRSLPLELFSSICQPIASPAKSCCQRGRHQSD